MSDDRFKFENNELSLCILGKWKRIEYDGYNFLELIGEGANGVVLKVQHQITDRIDALKVWLPNKKSKSGKVSEEQFLTEIRKISKIIDQNIVRVYDAKIVDNTVYMCAMEYIQGKSLKKWLKGWHRIEKRVQVCREILQTVERYQSQGIIHGDLHGGNIILDDDEHIHIIDFGTSLFGHDNQSKERESYFIYKLTEEILQEMFNREFFAIRNYDLYSAIKNCNDTRKFPPLLITQTMLYFVQLINIKVMTAKITDRDILIEYCNNIAHGIYFNLDKICEDLLDWSDVELFKSIFPIALYENIEDIIFDKDETNEIEEVLYCTLYIYYEKFNQCKDQLDIKTIKKHYLETHKGYVNSNEYDKYIEKLYDETEESYIELHKNLLKRYEEGEVREVDNNMRSILSDLLNTFYGNGFIYVLYSIWTRLNEIRVDRKLHYKIISMSMILRENNYL